MFIHGDRLLVSSRCRVDKGEGAAGGERVWMVWTQNPSTLTDVVFAKRDRILVPSGPRVGVGEQGAGNYGSGVIGAEHALAIGEDRLA